MVLAGRTTRGRRNLHFKRRPSSDEDPNTDKDVVVRAFKVTGIGRLNGPYVSNPKYKPIWMWTLARHADAVALASLLNPHLSEYRRMQIEKVLGPYSAWRSDEMLELDETAWAAGLLEGEAWFGFTRRAVVSVSSTCKDTLERLQEYFGGALCAQKATHSAWKPIYTWQLRGDRAAALMQLVAPSMGKRRSRAITKALHAHALRPRPNPGKFEDDKALRRAVATARTCREVLLKLKVTASGVNYDRLDRRCAELKIKLPSRQLSRRP